MGPVKLIDSAIKDELLRFPTVELIRRLFPGSIRGGRSLICNPLRDDRHPSLSCFRDYYGYQRWKDHATDETGDNIDFFRKVYPELGYVEAIDRMSLFLLGKSALQDFVPGVSVPVYSPVRRYRPIHGAGVKEEAPVLTVVSDVPYNPVSTPSPLVSYTRERGVSDEVASSFLHYVVYENAHQKGRSVIDPESGLPVVGEDGAILREDGRYEAIALPNDIGGYSLRVPPSETGGGFKGANMSFISTITAGNRPFAGGIRFAGRGDGFVTGFGYDAEHRYLSINQTQGFVGVEPSAVRPAVVFLDTWIGRYLEGRDLRGAEAVLRSLNGPFAAEVDVVEGMFDAVSVIEFEKMAGRGAKPVRDLMVLNSVSNIQWAVPFLAMHGKVNSLLDNDMSSSAGQKAYDVLKERVEAFASRLSLPCEVRSDSRLFYPCKDINDFLKKSKGFGLSSPQARASESSVISGESKVPEKKRRKPLREKTKQFKP